MVPFAIVLGQQKSIFLGSYLEQLSWYEILFQASLRPTQVPKKKKKVLEAKAFANQRVFWAKALILLYESFYLKQFYCTQP